MLKEVWKVNPSYSAWASIREMSDRRADPSYCILCPGADPEMTTITHAEAVALMDSGFFNGLAKVQSEGKVAVKEHAVDAISDFASETYAAWEKLRVRLDEARVTGQASCG
jgi:hypothetical protein